MKTRSLNTITNHTTIIGSFCLNDQYFDIRKLSFRNNNPVLIITFRNIRDNVVNSTKVLPIAELTYSATNKLRFIFKPSVNYPKLKNIDEIIFSNIKDSYLTPS